MARIKQYNQTAKKYAEKLEKRGYYVKFNWVDTVGNYDDVTVRGRKFFGYVGEFSTPRAAYNYIVLNKL